MRVPLRDLDADLGRFVVDVLPDAGHEACSTNDVCPWLHHREPSHRDVIITGARASRHEALEPDAPCGRLHRAGREIAVDPLGGHVVDAVERDACVARPVVVPFASDELLDAIGRRLDCAPPRSVVA